MNNLSLCLIEVYMKIEKMVEEMRAYGFAFVESTNEVEMTKTYKCYLSKKCNDEKYTRLKKMFDFCKNDPEFMVHMGADLKKLEESFAADVRGQVVKVDFDCMDINEVFKTYKLGVKEVCKKGYKVEDDTYVKI